MSVSQLGAAGVEASILHAKVSDFLREESPGFSQWGVSKSGGLGVGRFNAESPRLQTRPCNARAEAGRGERTTDYFNEEALESHDPVEVRRDLALRPTTTCSISRIAVSTR